MQCEREGAQACDEYAYAHAEAIAWAEQLNHAYQLHAVVSLSARQCGLLSVAAALLILMLCVVPAPPRARIARRLHDASRKLPVGRPAGGHLGVTLEFRQPLLGLHSATTCVTKLCPSDLLHEAGVREGDLLLDVDGIRVKSHTHGLLLLEKALGPAHGANAWGRGDTFGVRVVSATAARACERESGALYAPLWMRLWRACFVKACGRGAACCHVGVGEAPTGGGRELCPEREKQM